ncbi:Ribosome production factor 2 [Vanrija pseudolonga]|uniref:Ribosome production factor 2 homolog n=1 Tax=Vanrija pseudolonga TaxID=143232 RepID=A0AAF0Y694_9TREE|nr:Ribosome production factor 2 [Vanrija pseudolonga]
MSMLRTVKPKNARVKRALEEREAKLVENEKTAIFVRGANTSERVRDAMKDLYSLKRPHAVNFSKKNSIHPFEDASSLEFFGSKNDASLFVTGLHSKKRPHDLVFSRTFDGKVLDQIEVGIDGFRSMAEFDTPKASVGTRPLMTFHSDLFDTHPSYTQLKSYLLDFYQGHHETGIPLMDVEWVISVTAGPLAGELDAPGTALPAVHVRAYTIKLLSSGSRIPRVQLTEMGPSLDLSIRRVAEPDADMLKAANKRPKLAKKDMDSGLGKKKKNIETDDMGDKVGRIHLGKQDLSKLQSRKMKSLKVGRKVRAAEAAAGAGDDGMDEDDE